MTNNKDKKVLNVPNLRFPEFTNEWGNITIKEACSEFQSGKNIKAEMITGQGLYPVYGGNGLRGFTESYNHDGDYILIGRQGALCGNIRKVTGKTYVTEHAIAVCASKENETTFLQYLFQKMKLGQYSDQSAQPGLAVNKLLRLNINVPSKIEQAKIAKILSLIDERIITQNKIIEDLKKLKSAIIEIEYSPKDSYHSHIGGAIVQISKRNKDNHLCNVLSVSNRQGFIKQSEQFEDRNVASDDTSNYKIVEKNDFAYNPARINVGSIARLTKFETGIVSPMYICFRTKDCLLPEYLELFFESRNFFYHIQKRLEGSVRLCLSYEELCNIPIVIPSIEKQKQVDLHLSKLAQKIDLEMKILQFVQQQKTYLLHQMFI